MIGFDIVEDVNITGANVTRIMTTMGPLTCEPLLNGTSSVVIWLEGARIGDVVVTVSAPSEGSGNRTVVDGYGNQLSRGATRGVTVKKEPSVTVRSTSGSTLNPGGGRGGVVHSQHTL